MVKMNILWLGGALQNSGGKQSRFTLSCHPSFLSTILHPHQVECTAEVCSNFGATLSLSDKVGALGGALLRRGISPIVQIKLIPFNANDTRAHMHLHD